MRETDGMAEEYVPAGYVPLARAALCLTCSAIFTVGPTCPACASEHFMPLARWLSEREER